MSPHAVSNPAIPIPDFGRIESESRRAELESLQSRLGDRSSVVKFAHAAVSCVVASLVGGAAGKLFWDSRGAERPDVHIFAGSVVAAIAFGILLYGTIQFFRGRRDLREELVLFSRMKKLHRELHLDDPSALLPKE